MTLVLEPLSPANLDLLVGLAAHESLAVEFEMIRHRSGAEDVLTDPHGRPALRRLAFEDGVPVGFSFAYVLPSWQGDWAMLRIGVTEPARRRGIGTHLLEPALAEIRSDPTCREACVAAWIPSPSAAGFAAAHGFEHARYFWLMERPRGADADPGWPDGIDVRAYDGSTSGLEEWTQVYNRSFSEHYHGVVATVESCRAHTTRASFRADGMLLAYRNGVCVGFCRNELYPNRGEIGVVGVAPEARGVGLGRALVRWGARWLELAGAPRVTLMVDGENETALSLYRSEGFETVSTREIWSRPLP